MTLRITDSRKGNAEGTRNLAGRKQFVLELRHLTCVRLAQPEVAVSEKVVFLAFSNDKVESQGIDLITCKRCRNKTYLLVAKDAPEFHMLRCAACGDNIGAIGWAE